MNLTTPRQRWLASSMLTGVVLAVLASTAARAADADPAAGGEVEEVVVTGSLFSRPVSETASPIAVLTQQNLARAGIVTTTDAVRSISADGAGSISTGFQTGLSAGGSAVSLRGMGVSSTLVLIDGLRSTNFPISDDGHNSYVDLNSIPFSLVDRVEVLKDGASSTYGADAIGGVVNLILKKRFTGFAGGLEGGESSRGDAQHRRADLTAGFGDYAAQGWNLYVNGEYQHDGRVTNHSRGFPFNTLDLTSIGGVDNNAADNALNFATSNAVVVRVRQTDLNNPLAGGLSPLSPAYVSLNLNCANGTFTQATASIQGTGCKHNLVDEYSQIAPLQDRYAINGRFSFHVSDTVEGYVSASYATDFVSIINAPRAIRANQAYGAPQSSSSINPGIVLPVYVCSAGVNCVTAADRRLNPNNPFAAAFANDPANGAARIYYLFGDLKAGSDRRNEVTRATAGLSGGLGGWTWRVDAVAARDRLEITQFGFLNQPNLLSAINTGSYNFVDPSANSAAVRSFVSPTVVTPSTSQLLSLEAVASRKLMDLAGGPLQLALGAQVRREELTNRNQNARLDTYTLSTSAASGDHTVSAGYFELNAPVTDRLDLSASGRFDDYSEGFSHFSPKFTAKYSPFRQLALRGTYSQGFRAPTFAEAGPASAYTGFAGYVPPAAFAAAHGGATNPYAQAYNAGTGYRGNADLKPETSRSFTVGFVAQPVSGFTATVDYYNVRKKNLVVGGPAIAAARAAYYGQSNVTAACAAVAAVGAGYSCYQIDAVDPLFPNALPRLLILNAPYANVNALETEGVDVSATAKVDLPHDVLWTSRVEWTGLIRSDLITAAGVVQKYAETLGPYQLSSGNGTPRFRGSWQNTLQAGRYQVTATTYYVGRMSSVAADVIANQDCTVGNIYAPLNPVLGNRFCYIKPFVDVDLNGSVEVRDGLTLYANVGNVFDAKAPLAPPAGTSTPNYLTTWHYAGAIGRTFKLGVRFQY